MSKSVPSAREIASCIDHTVLRADATSADVQQICDEAIAEGFASVCVNPVNVALVADLLRDSDVKTCSVVAFPLGASPPDVKAAETARAVEDGADEVDMVINVGAAKSGDWDAVEQDIRAVVDAAGGRALVKVIIETCLLNDTEIVKACEASKRAGADYVKTSTGFSTGGATAQDVALMRRTVGDDMEVKASGGIHTYEEALAMIRAGASRIGTSSGMAIVAGAKAAGKEQ